MSDMHETHIPQPHQPEQSATPEGYAAELATLVTGYLDTAGVQPVAGGDGAVRELKDPTITTSRLCATLSESTPTDGTPPTYTYGAVGHDRPQDVQVYQWQPGDTTVKRGVSSLFDPEADVQPIEELELTHDLAAELSKRIRYAGMMAAHTTVKNNEKSAAHKPGAVSRTLGRLGIKKYK